MLDETIRDKLLFDMREVLREFMEVRDEIAFLMSLPATEATPLAQEEAVEPDEAFLFPAPDEKLSDWLNTADLTPDALYQPDFTIIPEGLAKWAQADETAAEFRARLKLLWQRFGIDDGKHFPGGGEALTGEEKITMREIDIVLNSDDGKANGLLEWLLADEK